MHVLWCVLPFEGWRADAPPRAALDIGDDRQIAAHEFDLTCMPVPAIMTSTWVHEHRVDPDA